MARTGMANPIIQLRALTDASAGAYSVNGIDYWSDDQMQAALDRNRQDVFAVELSSQLVADGSGTARYYDYFFEQGIYEEGTAQFIVATSTGSALAGSVMSVNYQSGHISFGAVDQRGTAYYLTARRFDINAAAAEVWKQKAAHVAMAYDFSADGQSMSRSQMMTHYKEMAELYSGMSAPMVATMRRGDN